MTKAASPWISMWTSPRKTIRALVDSNPSYGVFFLVTVFAFQDRLYYANWWSLGAKHSAVAILLGSLVIAPFFGWVWVYFAGWIFHFTGRWLHGHAPASHLRAALAWSKIPVFINLAAWFFYLVFLPDSLFILDGSPHPGIFNSIFLNFVSLVTGIWSFVLLLQAIREVQKFSVGLSFINVVMGWVIYFIFFVLISGLARSLYLMFA